MSTLRRTLVCSAFTLSVMLVHLPALAQQSPCTPSELLAAHLEPSLGTAQRHVEAADLDGNGLADLVVSTPSGILIVRGSVGPGGLPVYTQWQFLSGVMDATGSVITDLDGDGIKDIAVAGDAGGIHFFRGLGSGGVGIGQFVGYNRIDLGSAWDIAAADFDADGITDLVVTLRAGGIQVLFGQSTNGVANGQFSAGPIVPAPGSPKGMALGDMDDDGVLDVVVSSESNSVSVLRGLSTSGVPNGQFVYWVTIPMSGITFDVTVADFNKDGKLDIASANYGGQSVSIALSAGGTSFQAAVTITVPASPLGIDSGDFNHDGFPDLVVAATSGAASFLYLQNSGTVSDVLPGIGSYVSYGALNTGYGITAVDLDLDGGLDVVVPMIGEVTIFAAFNSCSLLRPVLTVNVLGAGTVRRLPDQPDYEPGSVVQLTAVPAAGSLFANWAGDLSGSLNPASITMSTSRAVTARFVAIQHRLTIQLAGTGQGTVTRSPTRATYDEGSTVVLAAVPEFGSVFAGWSGDATGSANPLELLIDGDKTVVASFVPDTTLAPAILAVTDVPLDQGGKLKLRWRASSLEGPGYEDLNRVTQYFVWREIPEAAFARAVAAAAGPTSVRRTRTTAREYFWEFVTSLPGSRFAGYSYTATTTNDSTELGNPPTAFMVQARNAAGTRWWDSAPDSGYSTDNLSPPPPTPLTARYGPSGNSFHWRPSRAPDLAGYRLHRSPERDFAPSAANLVGAPTDTAFFDPTPTAQYYKLAAIDIHGNRSHFVLVAPELPVGTLASLVAAEATADRIKLSWSMSQAGLEATLYRRTDAVDWTRLALLSGDGRGFMSYEDVAVERGVTYGYRLGIREADGESFYAETYVLAEDTRFAISGLTPNPSPSGRMTVRFVLPTAEPAVLELLDLAGRRLEQRTFGGQMGAQSVELGVGMRLTPGLYWLRLRHAGNERSVRAVVLN